MTAEQITTILTNLFTSGGVAIFFYFVVRSLRREITGLNKTIAAQNETLRVMEKQVSETEKIGDIYKGLITELPQYIDQYKKVIQVTKDSVIAELEQANQAKDEKLKETRELELKRLELQEELLAELPKLREELLLTTEAIRERVAAIEPNPASHLLVFGERGFGKTSLMADWVNTYRRELGMKGIGKDEASDSDPDVT